MATRASSTARACSSTSMASCETTRATYSQRRRRIMTICIKGSTIVSSTIMANVPLWVKSDTTL